MIQITFVNYLPILQFYSILHIHNNFDIHPVKIRHEKKYE